LQLYSSSKREGVKIGCTSLTLTGFEFLGKAAQQAKLSMRDRLQTDYVLRFGQTGGELETPVGRVQ
jgi:hypothetical protein